MARGRQVRLDDDIAAELDRRAAADGRTVPDLANRALRAALGLHESAQVSASAPREDAERPVQRASIGRSRATKGAGPCPHPVSRRHGSLCMACGTILRPR